MPDQPFTNRTAAEVVVEQGTPGSVVQQLTEAKLAQLRALKRLGLVEYDLMYYQVTAYLALPGRSPTHQRRMEDLGGHLMNGYDVAFDRVLRDAEQDILNNRPEVVVRTVTKYTDPPRKPFVQRVFG